MIPYTPQIPLGSTMEDPTLELVQLICELNTPTSSGELSPLLVSSSPPLSYEDMTDDQL